MDLYDFFLIIAVIILSLLLGIMVLDFFNYSNASNFACKNSFGMTAFVSNGGCVIPEKNSFSTYTLDCVGQPFNTICKTGWKIN